MRSIAIVGAGWSGVAAALTLSRAGTRVTVFEATRIAGGRARRVARDGRVVDNGQHLLLGAYDRTIRLIRSLYLDGEMPFLTSPLSLRTAPGMAPKLRLETPAVREPLNLLVGLIAADGLSAAEKIATVSWAARTLRGGSIDPTMTVAALIADQPILVRHLLWEPLCIAALNTPAENASAEVFVQVLRQTFSGEKNASRLIIPISDLTEAFPTPALAEIETRGGDIFFGTTVVAVQNAGDGVSTVLRDASRKFDAVIVAVGPQHVPRLVSQEPAAKYLADSLDSLIYEPITTLYFEFSHVTPSPADGVPMRMLSGEPGQWLFWSRLENGRWRAGVVISAHRRTEAETSLVASTLTQLNLSYRLPAPVWHFVITEKRATYACSPEQTALLRTLPKRIGCIHFAGDWCHPQLPATIEAAVIAGEYAANAVLEEVRDGN
jgi:hydroxysqualene dehydroxylase